VVSRPCLGAAATRPRHTPRSTSIANYLLSQGISPDPKSEDQPSALALAIKNKYFNLADILISRTNAETINAFHVWSEGEDPKSVLGMLLSNHTYSNLEGISYLAATHRNSSLSLKIHPKVNKSNGMSAMHVLAQYLLSEWNNYSQISARII
jgi:hypothetical protein